MTESDDSGGFELGEGPEPADFSLDPEVPEPEPPVDPERTHEAAPSEEAAAFEPIEPFDAEERPGEPDRPVRYWPDGPTAPNPHVVRTCEACGTEWWISTTLAGHRLRCRCAAWMDVPVPPALLPAPGASAPARRPTHVPRRRVPRPPSPARGYREAPGPMEPIVEIPTSIPMEPGTLRHASVDTKRRWTSRVVWELIFVMAAFWGPSLWLLFHGASDDSLLYWPFAGLMSGILVFAIGLGAPEYTFSGLRGTGKAYHYFEAILGALAFVCLVEGWVAFLEGPFGFEFGPDPLAYAQEQLGWFWTLVVVAVFPALFEEIAFRGLVQGRISALEGRLGGIFITGTAFALAHGAGFAMPFHLGGGFYLCWLRARSGSLYPGMVAHFVYNATLVIVHAS